VSTEAIRSRRSVRRYQDKKVPDEVVDDILECGMLAPTARNLQPWLLGAVTDKGLLKRIGSLADHGGFIADCAVCFAVFTLKDEKYRIEDGCAAAMNIIHACGAHGLGSCWVAGDKKAYAQDVRQLLKVPDFHSLVALVSAGYPDEKPQPKGKKAREGATFKNTL